MKELQIIVKMPDDGNPLNLDPAFAKTPDETRITVGYKFKHADGKEYGNYIYISGDTPDVGAAIIETIRLLAEDAFGTERRLFDNGGSDVQ